jgi:hypothetical protein
MLLRGLISILLVLMFSAVVLAGTSLTIENTTDKDVFVRIISKDRDWTWRVHIKAHSAKTFKIEYGKYIACAWYNGELGDCTDTEVTEENLYDEDGHKLYWEISEEGS